MTTPNMTAAVQTALEEIRGAFRGHSLEIEPDDQGGAFVKTDALPIGEQYEPSVSWVAFRITFQYPHADVYPHYCVPALKRKDGKPLGQGFHHNQIWQTPSKREAATMLSRRSNRLNPATDTAALKLAKVLDWMRNQ